MRYMKALVTITIMISLVIAFTMTAINIFKPNNSKPAGGYASQQEVAELRLEVGDLRKQLKQETHPARIQRRTMDWILQQGEFEGSNSNG